ncbi:MAG: HEAT repeat domain-containing protein, partial [Planctomycetes bacterium]|nr:HEAT repeat domain-containing protein [Planctomycetota bacterium]
MLRTITLLFTLLLLASGPIHGQQKDPLDEPVLKKTVGEWIKILRTHEDPKFRKVAILALDISNTGGRSGLPALLDCIEKDKDAGVRRDAVMLLGRLGPETRGAIK